MCFILHPCVWYCVVLYGEEARFLCPTSVGIWYDSMVFLAPKSPLSPTLKPKRAKKWQRRNSVWQHGFSCSQISPFPDKSNAKRAKNLKWFSTESYVWFKMVKKSLLSNNLNLTLILLWLHRRYTCSPLSPHKTTFTSVKHQSSYHYHVVLYTYEGTAGGRGIGLVVQVGLLSWERGEHQVSTCPSQFDWKNHWICTKTMYSHLMHLRLIRYQYKRGGRGVGWARGGLHVSRDGEKMRSVQAVWWWNQVPC